MCNPGILYFRKRHSRCTIRASEPAMLANVMTWMVKGGCKHDVTTCEFEIYDDTSEALSRWVDQYQHKLSGIAYGIVGDVHTAQYNEVI